MPFSLIEVEEFQDFTELLLVLQKFAAGLVQETNSCLIVVE